MCASAPVIVRTRSPLRGSIVSTTPGLADRNVHESGRRIEEGDVGRPGNRPHVLDRARAAVDLDQRVVVACDIETAARVIDVEAVRAAPGHLNCASSAQVGQAHDQHHRRLANAKKQALAGSISHAPARPSRQIDRRLPAIVRVRTAAARAFGVITDAGDNRPTRTCRRSQRRLGRAPVLKVAVVLSVSASTHGNARRAAIGDDDLPVIDHGPGRARKSRQGREVPARIVVDHLDAVARRMGDEHAPGFRVERGVIERAAFARSVSR